MTALAVTYSPAKATTEHGHFDKQSIAHIEAVKGVEDRFTPLQTAEKIVVEKKETHAEIARVVDKPSGSKEQWMAAAGIDQADYSYVDFIISHESGWNPCAFNPGQNDCNATPTTACGLVQALPCSKLGANWTDPVNALRWGDSYAKGRYGSWAAAYSFWSSNHWW